MSQLTELLAGLAGVAKRLDEASESGETDPLKIVDAMLGGDYSRTDAEQWWHLFGMVEKPATRAELKGAWSRWAARNHPDKGGDAISFGHMRATYERMLARFPE